MILFGICNLILHACVLVCPWLHVKLENSIWEIITQPYFYGWFAALGTIGAVSYAIFQDKRKAEVIIRANQERDSEVVITEQPVVIARLKVENTSPYKAKGVSVIVRDIANEKNKKNKNFIPAPLNWTHWNKMIFDIPGNSSWYIDLCQIRREDNRPELCVRHIPSDSEACKHLSYWKIGLDDVIKGENDLTLALQGENIKEYQCGLRVKINWNAEPNKESFKINRTNS